MNNKEWLSRTKLLVGQNDLTRLNAAHVLVVGLGGVGAYAAENICRAGIGRMTIVDGDKISVTNRNRQLLALRSTQQYAKTELMRNRMLDINPDIELKIINEYIKDDRIPEILAPPIDYVVDAIDTLSPKMYLIYHCMQKKIPLVSSMGSGGKFDPTLVQAVDFSDTYQCRLAYILRKKLRKLGVTTGFKAVFSPEKVDERCIVVTENEPNKKSTVGTISYMPPVFGCVCASVVIRDLMDKQNDKHHHF